MNDDIEPVSIANPSRKFYKFLFRVLMDDETVAIANDFIMQWMVKHDYHIKRQKLIHMPLTGSFEVRVWLI